MVDQGARQTAGWTDDESALIADGLPFIVFGDHTRRFKFVDYPFALGADGTQLLKPSELFDPQFSYYACRSLEIPNRGYNRHFSILKEQSLVCPPRREQERIAAVLARLDAAIDLENRLVAATRELKHAAMERLFTRGLRSESAKESGFGPIPESWEVDRIGNRCERPEYGVTASATEDSAGPRFLRITDITSVGVDWMAVPFCKCSTEQEAAKSLRENDILFARIGATTGKSFIVKSPPRAVFASYLIRIRPKPGVDPDYLFYFFSSPAYWQQVDANKRNNLKGGVSGSVLSSLLFPIPDFDEQREIARLLQTVDQAIQLHERKRTALAELCEALLDELMTGHLRLPESAEREEATA